MRIALSTIELVALFVGLNVLAQTFVEVAVWVAIAIFMVAFVSLLSGWRPPRIGSRSKAALVALVCFASFVNSGLVLNERNEAELEVLLGTDINAYLARLADLDDARWLAALEQHRPEEYKTELRRRREVAEADRVAQCTDRKAGQAYVMIQNDVRRQLRAPSTARFPGRMGEGTRHTGSCIYRVQGYFDAQNGFGAMIRGRFVGEIEYFPGERSWRTRNLKVNG